MGEGSEVMPAPPQVVPGSRQLVRRYEGKQGDGVELLEAHFLNGLLLTTKQRLLVPPSPQMAPCRGSRAEKTRENPTDLSPLPSSVTHNSLAEQVVQSGECQTLTHLLTLPPPEPKVDILNQLGPFLGEAEGRFQIFLKTGSHF